MQISNPTIFFGSGPVAASSLELLNQWHTIAAVVTKRTPPHHKEPAPVEVYAKAHGLPLLYADTKTELDTLTLPKVTYGIVIDFGVIISESVISLFPLGIINSHFSLLPEWRGADPITFALLSGQKTTGVSLMTIDKGMDTGNLLATQDYVISEQDTNASLTHQLIKISDALLQKTLPSYLEGTITPYSQPDTIATYSHKFTKQSGILNPTRTASELERQVRAFLGWPNSRLEYNSLWLTIATACISDISVTPGNLVIHEGTLLYGCKNGSLQIKELQPAGKNKMSASAFINGYAQKLSLQTI